MLTPGFEDTVALLEAYIAKRPRRGPFPLESAFTWSVLLNTQLANGIRGEMLEIGVEFGTSAFLMLESLRPEEHATLIDINTTAEWLEGINGPYRNRANYTYIEGNSLEMDPSALPTGCRWIHIDGGHLYCHVMHDLELTTGSLASDGILVLDDFFEIRWPDVSFATMEFLKDNTQIHPFLLVNRKLYCARGEEQGRQYASVFSSFVRENSARIGQVRAWDRVAMLGREVLVAKLELSGPLAGLEH